MNNGPFIFCMYSKNASHGSSSPPVELTTGGSRDSDVSQLWIHQRNKESNHIVSSPPALLSTRDAATENEHMHNHGGDPGWYQALVRRAPRGAVHVVLPSVHVPVLPWRCGDVHRHRTCQRDSVKRREGEEGLKKKTRRTGGLKECMLTVVISPAHAHVRQVVHEYLIF